MAQFTGSIPFSDIERIQIYNKKKKNTKAEMLSILKETGGDIVMNGSIFLRTLKPCCHLKADGKVLCAPDYKAWAIAWTNPGDFDVCLVPETAKENWMECVAAIVAGKKTSPMNYRKDMGYATNRTVIGTKNYHLAYLVTEKNYTPEQIRDICYKDGWDNAIMMDGGGSSCIRFSDGTGFSGDGRYVPFWFVVHLRKKICPYKEPTASVRSKSRGEGVKWTQWHLNQHGNSLTVDGVFGPKSVAALKAYQLKSGLVADGICGPKTRAELKKY